MKVLQNILCLLFLLLFLANSKAQDSTFIFIYPSAKEVDVLVRANVSELGNQFIYKYELHSLSSSQQDIWTFRLEYEGNTGNRLAPNGWSVFALRGTNLVTWGAGDSTSFIPPGNSLAGFRFHSPGLPSIKPFYVEGFIELPILETEPDTIVGGSLIENSKSGKTIGPKPAPNPFSATAFLDTLITYTNQSLVLGWIANQLTADKYTNLFSTARSQLESNDTTGARVTLTTILTNVPGDSAAALLTSEAYALQRFNTEYLLSQLPVPENILSVPAQFATIQAAVDASQPGDVIEVSSGFYNEQVSLTGRDSLIVRTTGSLDGVICKGFLLKQSHHVTIKGFVVDASGTNEHGIVLMGGNNQNSDVTLEANAIKNAGNDFSGISVARGNPRTRIVNNRMHDNGRNGIRFIDATGGPHYLVNNTIVQNGWNGVDVARQHVIYLVNNILSFNGTKSGSTGGRYGVLREAMAGSGEAGGITLLNNLIVGNNGQATSSSSQDLGNYAQTLDGADSGNLTTSGAEGSGVSASPAVVFADIFVSQTPLDLHLKASSVAIDRGLNSYNPPDATAGSIPTNDFEGESRPQGAAVDLGADERL